MSAQMTFGFYMLSLPIWRASISPILHLIKYTQVLWQSLLACIPWCYRRIRGRFFLLKKHPLHPLYLEINGISLPAKHHTELVADYRDTQNPSTDDITLRKLPDYFSLSDQQKRVQDYLYTGILWLRIRHTYGHFLAWLVHVRAYLALIVASGSSGMVVRVVSPGTLKRIVERFWKGI